MGQWMAQGPGMLRALRYVPFLSWTVNAYKFIYATMPQDHPILTGLFAAANTASAQQRAAVGLSGPFAGNPNEVELAQESGIPLPGGKIFSSAGHYFPGSAVGDPFSAVGDVLPPFQPLLDASLGVQFTGEFPKNAQGKRVRPDAWTMAQMALGGMLDSIAGPYRIIKQFATKPPSAGREFFGIEPRFAQTPPPKSSAGGYSTGGYSTGGYSTGSYSTGGYP